MRQRCFVFGLVILVACAGFGQKPAKKKSNFPQLILAARYVYVTAVFGDQFDRRTAADERQVISAVDDALHQWGRYTVVHRAEDADITLLLRVGDVKLTDGIGVPGAPRRSVGIGGYDRADAGSPDDLLMVVRGGEEPTGAAALWRRSRHNGLQSPALTLFQEFKKEVEQAAAANNKP